MKAAVFLLVIACSACGGKDSPSSPSASIPNSSVSLTGTVSVIGGGQITGATVQVVDGPNAGRSAKTNSAGAYVIDALTPGNANVIANATIYDEVVVGVFINGSNTANFTFAIPACQSNNTATVSFGNRSTATTQDIVWDGSRLFTLTPGQTSDPITVAAAVAHTLQFKVANTSRFACATSTPILSHCDRGSIFTCAGP